MLVARHGWIPELIGVHLENLESLWHQREAMLGSSTHHAWDLARVDRRIAAHSDALLLAGETAFAALGAGLGGETAGQVCAAAYVLLLGEAYARSVWDLLATAEGPVLQGLRQALRAGPVAPLLAELRQAAAADEPLACAAAEILAIRGEAEPAVRLLERRIPTVAPDSADAAELCALLSLVGSRAAQSRVVPAWLRAAARAADRDLRKAALHAAAWTRQPWLLADLRQRCGTDPEALLMLGILGEPADLAALLAAEAPAALGAFGHPGGLPVLLAAMAGADPRAAVAAGAAFLRMTGVAPWSETRVELPPADGASRDALDAEFAELAYLPLASKAADWQQRHGSGATRLQGGRELDERLQGPDLEGLSLRASVELRMVAQYRGVSEQRAFSGLLPMPESNPGSALLPGQPTP